MSVLCLLDLSAAFAPRPAVLQRLERQFGLCDTAFQWTRPLVSDYLSGRTFRVVYGDVMSFIVYVMCSVTPLGYARLSPRSVAFYYSSEGLRANHGFTYGHKERPSRGRL